MPDRFPHTAASPVRSDGRVRDVDFTRDGFAVQPRVESAIDDLSDWDLDDDALDAETAAECVGLSRFPSMEG